MQTELSNRYTLRLHLGECGTSQAISGGPCPDRGRPQEGPGSGERLLLYSYTLWLRASAACESHCLNYTLPPSLHHYSRGDPRLLQSLWGLSASLFTPGRQHLCPVHIHIHPNFKVSKGKGHPTHPMRTPSPQLRCRFPPCALIIAGRRPHPFFRTCLCFCLQLPSSALALSCWCELSIFKVPS